MLVIMGQDSTKEQCEAVEEAIRRMGFTPLPVPGANRTAICVTGNRGPVEAAFLNQLPGVLECIPVTKPYKLVSREVHPEDYRRARSRGFASAAKKRRSSPGPAAWRPSRARSTSRDR